MLEVHRQSGGFTPPAQLNVFAFLFNRGGMPLTIPLERSVPFTFCPLPSALCSLLFTLCAMHYAPCALPSALCHIRYELITLYSLLFTL